MSSSSGPVHRVRRWAAASVVALAALSVSAVEADVDLAALQVMPQRGQTAEQARRDRYECHTWAVEQTGVVPRVRSSDGDEPDTDQARRADRVGRAIAGAAIGAALGSLFGATRDRHGRRDADTAVLAGAAVGAAVGAATAKGPDERTSKTTAPPADEDYLRALSACLEGRGYTVSLPER